VKFTSFVFSVLAFVSLTSYAVESPLLMRRLTPSYSPSQMLWTTCSVYPRGVEYERELNGRRSYENRLLKFNENIKNVEDIRTLIAAARLGKVEGTGGPTDTETVQYLADGYSVTLRIEIGGTLSNENTSEAAKKLVRFVEEVCPPIYYVPAGGHPKPQPQPRPRPDPAPKPQ